MSKWKREIKKYLVELGEQVERHRPMALSIIPASVMPQMIEAGKSGDLDARMAIDAFVNWSKVATEAEAEGVAPVCVICSTAIVPVPKGGAGLGGWAQIMPADRKEGTGIVAPLCARCIKLDREEVIRVVQDRLESDMGLRAMMMQ